jgi:ribosomal-protein-alanine N-acetyltransferase
VSVIIRAADVSDAGALARIHTTCFDAPWDAASFQRLLDGAGMIALVAKHAAETDLQSFILVQTAADESEIISFGTHVSARRLGLARALLMHAAAEAARRGAKAMYLEVAEDNSAALALYYACGFTLQGRRKSYYESKGGSVDAMILRARLPLRELWE